MQALASESTILNFTSSGDPADHYLIILKGPGPVLRGENRPVELDHEHRIEVRLGSEYPRGQPYLRWQTPIYHPNIAVSGAVCLGGYSSHWTPGLTLDHLCEMLWDMLRFENYDTESPYNHQAAQWARRQTTFRFPLDPRPLRDRKASGAAPAPAASKSQDREDFVLLDEESAAAQETENEIEFLD